MSHLPKQPQQQTLSRGSSVTSRFVPQTFQHPQQPAPAAREYILTIPESHMPVSPVFQPIQQIQVAAKGQQQPSGQTISFLVVDDLQARPSRPLTFTLTPTKHFNLPSVASVTGKESQQNISGLPSFFGNLQSVMSYQPSIHSSHFHHPVITSCLSSNHHHQQQPAQPQASPKSSDTKQQQQ